MMGGNCLLACLLGAQENLCKTVVIVLTVVSLKYWESAVMQQHFQCYGEILDSVGANN